MEQFDVTREQIAAVLDFVAQSLRALNLPQDATPVDAILFDHGTPCGIARAQTRPSLPSPRNEASSVFV
jgi:hypothetical protein